MRIYSGSAEARDGGSHANSLITSLCEAKCRVLSAPRQSPHNSPRERQGTHLLEKVMDRMLQLGSLIYKIGKK